MFTFNYEGKTFNLFLPAAGDFVPDKIRETETFYEVGILEAIREKLKDQKVDTILDIGSFFGNHALYFGEVIGAKRVYAFEPVPESFEYLRLNLEAANPRGGQHLRYYKQNIALGNEEAKIGMRVYPENRGASTLWVKSEEEAQRDGFVWMQTLDSLQIDGKITFIKIDVEGHELEVLKGGKETILKNKPLILLECNLDEGIQPLKDFLLPLGYELTGTLNEGNPMLWFEPTESIDPKTVNKLTT